MQEENAEIKKFELEKEKLKKRKREMEEQFIEENKIDKLVFDKEYQAINNRIDELEKLMNIEVHETKIEEDIADFKKRLKNEVERMLKEQ